MKCVDNFNLYTDPDFQEKMQQEEPYEDVMRCDECGAVIDDYYFVVDDYIYCEDCMYNHRYRVL